MSEKNLNYIDIFKALSDPIRLELLRKISSTECMCVCELTDIYDLSQSKLSYHLKLLLNANLITKIPQGKWNFYAINKDTLNAVLNCECICDLLNNKKLS